LENDLLIEIGASFTKIKCPTDDFRSFSLARPQMVLAHLSVISLAYFILR